MNTIKQKNGYLLTAPGGEFALLFRPSGIFSRLSNPETIRTLWMPEGVNIFIPFSFEIELQKSEPWHFADIAFLRSIAEALPEKSPSNESSPKPDKNNDHNPVSKAA